ncbi:MAG: hypothetical protein EBS29_02230 [Chloroflexia bacterium]|nr:hypothetical protein [Chloroflexia bacterium]
MHQVWINGHPQPDTWVDITDDLETKIAALRHHVSQVTVGDGEFIRKWAAEEGAAANLAFAEHFKVMKLVNEEPA